MNIKKIGYFRFAFMLFCAMSLHAMDLTESHMENPDKTTNDSIGTGTEANSTGPESEDVDIESLENKELIASLANDKKIEDTLVDPKAIDSDLLHSMQATGFTTHATSGPIPLDVTQVISEKNRQSESESKANDEKNQPVEVSNRPRIVKSASFESNFRQKKQLDSLANRSLEEGDGKSNGHRINKADLQLSKAVLDKINKPDEDEESVENRTFFEKIGHAAQTVKNGVTTTYNVVFAPYSSDDVISFTKAKNENQDKHSQAKTISEKVKAGFGLLLAKLQLYPREHAIIGNLFLYSGFAVIVAGSGAIGYKVYKYFTTLTGPFIPLLKAAEEICKRIDSDQPIFNGNEAFSKEFRLMNFISSEEQLKMSYAFAALEIHQPHDSQIVENLINFIRAFERSVVSADKELVKIAYKQLGESIEAANKVLRNHKYYNKMGEKLKN